MALSSCNCWLDLIPSLETEIITIWLWSVWGKRQQSERAYLIFLFFYAFVKISSGSTRYHIKMNVFPPSRNRHQSAPPFSLAVNTARPNTVKLISSHHRSSFWFSDKSILSLIINCDTRNRRKAAAVNKWHVFCVIILCILTNMTH